ncbi:ArsR/SmtB family transcription factor [Actinomadura macrotermitis]|uniref:HTH arsR-type domain-containing protein n=1 Tax=Actinomadura macrotermitis TaxID=2585200 RepID=A0A7K0C5N4_9ACTN|nr:hypothetical protein [Actinomadura macrotermitis]
MGWWRVDADTLAQSRFVVSPLAETVACVKVLAGGSASHPGERAWLGEHLPAYRERLAGDPVAAALVRAGLCGGWNATFLTPPPGGEASFEREVALVGAVAAEAARADLRVALGGPLPAGLCRDDLPGRAAELLEWVWRQAVRPSWERRRRVLEADVLVRVERLGRGGWAAALEGTRSGLRWLGDGRLQIGVHEQLPRQVSGARLVFVPVTPDRSWVAWDRSGRSAVVYPCAGVLAGRERVPGGLARLLGAGRAQVLVLLESPKSSTQLVALTGQGLGSVGRHLRVLLEAGLVRRRRAGRSVLYSWTQAGEVLVRAQRDR